MQLRKLRHSKYLIGSTLGSGGFGTVYSASAITGTDEVAIKSTSDPAKVSDLENEYRMYLNIGDAVGFPAVFDLSCEADQSFLTMELLGKSIATLLRESKPHFSMKTVLMLIDQMLARVEFIHHKGILHRDLKPSNFLMGRGSKSNQVYLVDFGLATRYTRDGIGYRSFVGTSSFASINSQIGMAVSRRDDLESLGYVFVYMATGSLPWRFCASPSRSSDIASAKLSVSPADLCLGLPDEFQRYMEAVRNLEYDEMPDYAGYRKLFRQLFQHLQFEYDYKYDWVTTVKSQLSFEIVFPKLLTRRDSKPSCPGPKKGTKKLSSKKAQSPPPHPAKPVVSSPAIRKVSSVI
jgi:serine/threonine protein kinase